MESHVPVDYRKGIELGARNLRLFWWVFLSSQVFLIFIHSTLPVLQQNASEVQMVHDTLIFAGFLFLGFGWGAPKIILKFVNRRVEHSQVSAHQNQVELASILPWHLKAYLIRLVGFEGATMMGFVTFMMGAGSIWVTGLFVLSTASILLIYPTQRFLDSWTKVT